MVLTRKNSDRECDTLMVFLGNYEEFIAAIKNNIAQNYYKCYYEYY